jgi:hypothetical protein
MRLVGILMFGTDDPDAQTRVVGTGPGWRYPSTVARHLRRLPS